MLPSAPRARHVSSLAGLRDGNARVGVGRVRWNTRGTPNPTWFGARSRRRVGLDVAGQRLCASVRDRSGALRRDHRRLPQRPSRRLGAQGRSVRGVFAATGGVVLWRSESRRACACDRAADLRFWEKRTQRRALHSRSPELNRDAVRCAGGSQVESVAADPGEPRTGVRRRTRYKRVSRAPVRVMAISGATHHSAG